MRFQLIKNLPSMLMLGLVLVVVVVLVVVELAVRCADVSSPPP